MDQHNNRSTGFSHRYARFGYRQLFRPSHQRCYEWKCGYLEIPAVHSPEEAVNDAIYLNGIGYNGTNTITFSQAVENPLIAIWSLGQPGLAASFTFNATPTLQAGGPNAQYGGSSITVAGNVVRGQEGNGVVMFQGTFTSLTFTTTAENYYGFTVGLNAASPPPSGVPEPSSLGLMSLGFLGCATGLRARRSAS